MHNHHDIPSMPLVSVLLAALSIAPSAIHLQGITETAQVYLPLFQCAAAGAACIAAILSIIISLRRKHG